MPRGRSPNDWRGTPPARPAQATPRHRADLSPRFFHRLSDGGPKHRLDGGDTLKRRRVPVHYGRGFAFRRQLVGLLSAQGMSTRAIAPTVGVTDRQVRYDAQVGKDFPPVPGSTVATRDGVVIAEQQHIDLADALIRPSGGRGSHLPGCSLLLKGSHRGEP